MNNEYVIINKTAILKRIEGLEKELSHHNEWYEKARERFHQDRKNWGNADDGEMRVASDAASTTAQEIKILKQNLSQSTPLIPEIEKAYIAGEQSRYSRIGEAVLQQDYITNLKLDI